MMQIQQSDTSQRESAGHWTVSQTLLLLGSTGKDKKTQSQWYFLNICSTAQINSLFQMSVQQTLNSRQEVCRSQSFESCLIGLKTCSKHFLQAEHIPQKKAANWEKRINLSHSCG